MSAPQASVSLILCHICLALGYKELKKLDRGGKDRPPSFLIKKEPEPWSWSRKLPNPALSSLTGRLRLSTLQRPTPRTEASTTEPLLESRQGKVRGFFGEKSGFEPPRHGERATPVPPPGLAPSPLTRD